MGNFGLVGIGKINWYELNCVKDFKRKETENNIIKGW